jgi:hypothetical protein
MVITESWKWRSGREADRVVGFLPERGGPGGETPCSFSDEKGVTSERDGDVMVPASEAAALEVVEAQLAFHVLVDAFGAPALLDQLHELDEGHALVRREVKVARCVVVTVQGCRC